MAKMAAIEASKRSDSEASLGTLELPPTIASTTKTHQGEVRNTLTLTKEQIEKLYNQLTPFQPLSVPLLTQISTFITALSG